MLIPLHRRPDPRLALVICLAAVVVFAVTLRHALVLDPLPGALAPPSPDVVVAIAPRPTLPVPQLVAAVAQDPFHPERRRPTERFRLPGELLPGTAAVDAVAATDPAGSGVTLIGTAVLPEGRGFAMCRWGAEPPKLVRIGERVGDLTLKRVAQGRAVFVTTAGQRVEVQVPKAGT